MWTLRCCIMTSLRVLHLSYRQPAPSTPSMVLTMVLIILWTVRGYMDHNARCILIMSLGDSRRSFDVILWRFVVTFSLLNMFNWNRRRPPNTQTRPPWTARSKTTRSQPVQFSVQRRLLAAISNSLASERPQTLVPSPTKSLKRASLILKTVFRTI